MSTVSTVLITGCNRGLGKHTAVHFARHGARVFATVRDPSQASALAQLSRAERLALEILPLDVTDQTSVDQAIRTVHQRTGHLDVLINNAGIHTFGAFEDLPEAAVRQVMETNFFGTMRVTRAVLPLMRAQGSGVIVMVTGLSGRIGMPGETAYTASKFALEGAAESLQYEVERFGIRVAIVEPSFCRTDEHSHRNSPAVPTNSPYHSLIRKLSEHHTLAADTDEDPQLVAEAIYAAVSTQHPKLRTIPGRLGRAAAAYRREVSDEEYSAALRLFLNIDWWTKGEAEF